MRLVVSVVLLAAAAVLSGCVVTKPFLDRPHEGDEHLVMLGFRRKDQNGLYAEYSRNGMTWMHANNDKPLFAWENTVRDPSVVKGPDGVWCCVFTTNRPRMIGYTESRDFMNWDAPRYLPVMRSVEACQNAWAPDLFWDAGRSQWIVFWSSTVEGMFTETAADGDGNNRIWACTTKDFKTFGPPRVFFDPGYNAIDATMIEHEGRYCLIFKDERLNKPRKYMRAAWADDPMGPWSEPSGQLTPQYTEGPTLIRVGGRWMMYYDFYNENRFGGAASSDLVNWDDKTLFMSFEGGVRHGSVVRVTPEIAQKLLGKDN